MKLILALLIFAASLPALDPGVQYTSGSITMWFATLSKETANSLGLPVRPGGGQLQVWVSTEDSETKGFRVTARYSSAGESRSETVELEKRGRWSGASFVVPDDAAAFEFMIEAKDSGKAEEFK